MRTLDPLNPSLCPLCGGPNDCQLCSSAAHKGPCWCASVEISETLLARVPEASRNRACICRHCIAAFHRATPEANRELKIRPGDFYFDNGLMVFTAAYHLRRGFCCDSNCRHCPYPKKLSALPV